jgi:hypothetical protein
VGEELRLVELPFEKKNWKRTLVSEALIPYKTLKTLIELIANCLA